MIRTRKIKTNYFTRKMRVVGKISTSPLYEKRLYILLQKKMQGVFRKAFTYSYNLKVPSNIRYDTTKEI
jgi:hypothetical protein